MPASIELGLPPSSDAFTGMTLPSDGLLAHEMAGMALGDRIVEIQHPVNIEANVPYAKLQDDVHRLLLGALRFDEPGGARVDES